MSSCTTSALGLPVGDGQECEAIHGSPGQAVSQITTKPHPQQGWETQQLLAGRGPVLVHSLQDLVIQGQDVLQLSLREPLPVGRRMGNTAVSPVCGGHRCQGRKGHGQLHSVLHVKGSAFGQCPGPVGINTWFKIYPSRKTFPDLSFCTHSHRTSRDHREGERR